MVLATKYRKLFLISEKFERVSNGTIVSNLKISTEKVLCYDSCFLVAIERLKIGGHRSSVPLWIIYVYKVALHSGHFLEIFRKFSEHLFFGASMMNLY